MFRKWLAGKANDNALNNDDPLFLDIEWFRGTSTGSTALSKLREEILNDRAKFMLAKRLKEDGIIDKMKPGETISFDYFCSGNKDAWRYRSAHQHQRLTVSFWEKLIPMDMAIVAPLRGFSLYGLAKGRVTLRNDGKHVIYVD